MTHRPNRSPPTIALIVGNGITIDLLYSLGDDIRTQWNTQSPLSWRHPHDDYKKYPPLFLDFPEYKTLHDRVKLFRSMYADGNDFALIQRIANQRRPITDGADANYGDMLRHFLTHAFAFFNHITQSRIDKAWRWVCWLRANKNALRFVVSFNYDLTIETALAVAGIPASRCGLTNESGGLRIYKPHASFDFDFFQANPTIRIFNSNTPQRSLEPSEYFNSRSDAILVLPGMITDISDHQAVSPGFQEFKKKARAIDRCYVIGMSYGDADRTEIDSMLEQFESHTTIVCVNPNPSAEFEAAVRARGLGYELWKTGPR